jgi:acetyl-CoA carboxylase biotin carboxyl carrier protein
MVKCLCIAKERKKEMSWVVKRVEAVLDALKGSSIGEIELAEGEVEIIVRRSPGNVVAVRTQPRSSNVQQENTPASASHLSDVKSPLTGVYYSSPSPTTPPFVKVGDSIKAGQTIALIEAMKVFSEVAADATGRVVAIKAQNGDVVKKGDVLLQVEPM